MSTSKDGGPAFPRPASEGHHAHDGEHLHGYGEQSGMSLRDWFIGKANAALIVALSATRGQDGYSDEAMIHEAARLAAISADSMLAARSATQTKENKS